MDASGGGPLITPGLQVEADCAYCKTRSCLVPGMYVAACSFGMGMQLCRRWQPLLPRSIMLPTRVVPRPATTLPPAPWPPGPLLLTT
jgi:hypothetical protein